MTHRWILPQHRQHIESQARIIGFQKGCIETQTQIVLNLRDRLAEQARVINCLVPDREGIAWTRIETSWEDGAETYVTQDSSGGTYPAPQARLDEQPPFVPQRRRRFRRNA